MKTHFWKKTAAGLLALLVITGTSPAAPLSGLIKQQVLTAHAEEEHYNKVYTGEDVKKYNGGSMRLMNDVTMEGGGPGMWGGESSLVVSGGTKIDLNGHTLTLKGFYASFWISSTDWNACLIVEDSSIDPDHYVPGQKIGAIYLDPDDPPDEFAFVQYGKMIFKSGAIINPKGNAITTNGGTVEITTPHAYYSSIGSLSEKDSVRFVYGNGCKAPNADDVETVTYSLAGETRTYDLHHATVDDQYFWGNGNDGSESKPYVISNKEGWNALSDAMADLKCWNRFSGKHFKLGRNISVTRMVGFSNHDFCGSFDGDGHSLEFNYKTDQQYAAPFSYTSETARIENLWVNGTIETSAKYAGGLIGAQWGTATIDNCRSNVKIISSVQGDGTHGGFVGRNQNNCTLNIAHSAFTGEMLGTETDRWGGFVGWNNGTLRIDYSVLAPSAVSIKTDETPSENFYRGNDAEMANCYYYDKSLGGTQGTRVYQIIPIEDQHVSIDKGDGTEYAASKLKFYNKGFDMGDVFYASAGSRINLGHEEIDKYTFVRYTTTAGTVSGNVLAVGNGNANIGSEYKKTVYTAKWVNGDGTVLKTETLYPGETPTPPDNPTMERTPQYTYTFVKWDKDIAPVTSDVTFTAEYSETVNQYKVTWKNYDNSVLYEQTLDYGSIPSYHGETPVKVDEPGYTYVFTGFNSEPSAVHGDQTYYAQFEKQQDFYSITLPENMELAVSRENGTFTYGYDIPFRPKYGYYVYRGDVTSNLGEVTYDSYRDLYIVTATGNVVITADVRPLEYTFVPEVPATCSSNGKKAHYKGSDGYAYTLQDNIYQKVSSEKSLEIPALAHTMGEPVWTWMINSDTNQPYARLKICCTECQAVICDTEVNGADITSKVTKEPTATEEGIRTYTATYVCDGVTFTDSSYTEAIPKNSADACIGETMYPTLKAAIEAAESGDVVKVLADVNEPDVGVGYWPYLYNDFTLDLNQHTVTLAGIDITNHLTIKNGTLNCAIGNSSGGGRHILTLDNATVHTPVAESEDDNSISWGAKGITLTNGSHLTISGGTFYFGSYEGTELSIEDASDVAMTNVRISLASPSEEVLAGIAKYLPNGYTLTYDEDMYGYYITDSTGNKVTEKVMLKAQAPAIDIAGANLTFDKASVSYTGEEITPVLTVKYGDTTLTEGVDYEIAEGSVTSATAAGDYTVTVNGIGSYKGTATAIWQIAAPKQYSITVENGTIRETGETSGVFDEATPVIVVGDTKKGYWTDESGNIISYNRKYKLYAMYDTVLTWHDDETQEAAAVASINLSERTYNATTGKTTVKVTSEWSLPAGATIIEAGTLRTASTEEITAEQLKSATYFKKSTLTTTQGTFYFNINLSEATKNKTIYAMTYVKYSDKDGEHIVYSQMMTSAPTT